jgi:hypothetical protein
MDRSLFLARLMGPTFVAIALGKLRWVRKWGGAGLSAEAEEVTFLIPEEQQHDPTYS